MKACNLFGGVILGVILFLFFGTIQAQEKFPDRIIELVPKQARMERQITADAGGQRTGRTCCELVNPPQTEGVLLLPRFGSPY